MERFRAFIPSQWRALAALTVVLAAIPFAVQTDYGLLLYNVMALNALVVLGLNVLIGCAGQVSFGHAAFYGMGAYLTAFASTSWQWPLALSIPFALGVTGLVGLLLSLPILRLEGHYLVMATLGFNVIFSILLNQMEGVTGGPSGLPGIPQIRFFSFAVDSDSEFYYFIWAVFLIIFALTLNLTDSRIGRGLHAIHQKELTARVLGIPAHHYKVTAFVISALYAGLAGCCYAHYVTFISPGTFDIFYSVQVVTMVVVGGMGSLWGGLAGAAVITFLPELLHHFEDFHVLLYGLILTGVLVFCPKGLLPTLLSLRIFPRRSPTSRASENGRKPKPAWEPREASPQGPEDRSSIGETGKPPSLPVLDLEKVSYHFGGLQALHEVSMKVFPGEVVALIGPNGAGKTTLLNVVSGLLRPQEGTVRLKGGPLGRLAPHRIAAKGVGRTFQTVQIFSGWTVLDNVLLGCHALGRSGFATAYLHSPGERKEESRLRRKAMALLENFQLASQALGPCEQLSLMEQKLLEVTRALALSPSVLLLDEPAGGLNPRESQMLVDLISSLRRQGMGVVLVEHDMNVVMRLADRVIVLQNGRLIAQGTPREVQRDSRVIAAYLGTTGGWTKVRS